MNNMQKTSSKNYSNTFAFCKSFNTKYKILDKIAEGQSSNVFLIQNKKTKVKYALKAFNHLSTQGIKKNHF
jgi:serine/threonine protein kinase